MINKTNTEPMDEAYKMLSGSPSSTGVSDAAKGVMPQSAAEEVDENNTQKTQRVMGQADDETTEPANYCDDINAAYAMLFESLAVIMKSK